MTTEAVDRMADYLTLEKQQGGIYKAMDALLSDVVMEEKGWEVPALFTYTEPVTGDRYAINVIARAKLIERGTPKEA